jgi:hypothetical protein
MPVIAAPARQQSYLGFPCEQCKTPLRVFTIPAHLPTPPVPRLVSLPVRCHTCDHEAEYRGWMLTRYEAAQIIS